MCIYVYLYIHIWKHIFKYNILKRFWMLVSLCPFLRVSREYKKTAIMQILENSTRKVKSCVIPFFPPINKKTNRMEDDFMTSFRSNCCQNHAFCEGWLVAMAFLHFECWNVEWMQKYWIVLGIPSIAQVDELLLYLQKRITKTCSVCQNYPCDLNV